MSARLYLHRMERFCRRCGVSVARDALHAGILGRAQGRHIVLRAGLSSGQQLLTLTHELTHVIWHCGAAPRIDRTVCEYEAEAAERWVGAALRVGPPDTGFDARTVTDDLLIGSVLRVRSTVRLVLNVARGVPVVWPARLQPQAAVEIDAPAGEEIVLDDELHRLRDLVRLPQPL